MAIIADFMLVWLPAPTFALATRKVGWFVGLNISLCLLQRSCYFQHQPPAAHALDLNFLNS